MNTPSLQYYQKGSGCMPFATLLLALFILCRCTVTIVYPVVHDTPVQPVKSHVPRDTSFELHLHHY